MKIVGLASFEIVTPDVVNLWIYKICQTHKTSNVAAIYSNGEIVGKGQN